MSYFEEKNLKRLTLPSDPDAWVDIRTKLRWQDAKALAALTDDEGNVANEIEASDKMVLAVVAAWSLAEADGTPAPIDLDHINKLLNDDLAHILNQATAALEVGKPKKNSSNS